MKKFKQIQVYKQEVSEIICNMCGKQMPIDDWGFSGGYFIPSFSYGSRHDSIEQYMEQIDMCDDCWDKFFDSMKIDPRPNLDCEEGDE